MTRSSIVAAVVVTALLAILIWSREDRAPERATGALSRPAGVRAPGEVAAVSSTRPVAPAAEPSIPFEGASDAGTPASR